MWRDHYHRLTRYNRWQNEHIYRLCEQLDDSQRKAMRGLFFHSIHGTLNHLLLADRLWLGRFTGQPFEVDGLDQELYQDFDTLRNQRALTDAHLADYAATLDDTRLADATLGYTSASTGQARRFPLTLCLTHLFNHQTHHRGQITTALCQLGLDVGVTDLIFMPEHA